MEGDGEGEEGIGDGRRSQGTRPCPKRDILRILRPPSASVCRYYRVWHRGERGTRDDRASQRTRVGAGVIKRSSVNLDAARFRLFNHRAKTSTSCVCKQFELSGCASEAFPLTRDGGTYPLAMLRGLLDGAGQSHSTTPRKGISGSRTPCTSFRRRRHAPPRATVCATEPSTTNDARAEFLQSRPPPAAPANAFSSAMTPLLALLLLDLDLPDRYGYVVRSLFTPTSTGADKIPTASQNQGIGCCAGRGTRCGGRSKRYLRFAGAGFAGGWEKVKSSVGSPMIARCYHGAYDIDAEMLARIGSGADGVESGHGLFSIAFRSIFLHLVSPPGPPPSVSLFPYPPSVGASISKRVGAYAQAWSMGARRGEQGSTAAFSQKAIAPCTALRFENGGASRYCAINFANFGRREGRGAWEEEGEEGALGRSEGQAIASQRRPPLRSSPWLLFALPPSRPTRASPRPPPSEASAQKQSWLWLT